MHKVNDCVNYMLQRIDVNISFVIADYGDVDRTDVEFIAEELMTDPRIWVGVEGWNETLLAYFTDNDDLRDQALRKKDYQEIGVLLSEYVHTDLCDIIARRYKETTGKDV